MNCNKLIKMSKPLFIEESDSDNDIGLGTNKDYAKSYNKLRQKELLKKRKLKIINLRFCATEIFTFFFSER